MTFQEHLEWASRVVAGWPAWKRNVLGGRQPYYRIEWKDKRGWITRYAQMYLTLEQAANAARVRSLLPEHKDDTMFVYNPVEELVATYYRGQGMAVNDGLGLSHISPNGAIPGTWQYAAEAWVRDQGLQIPTMKHPRMYQGMLDDFQESGAYDLWAEQKASTDSRQLSGCSSNAGPG